MDPEHTTASRIFETTVDGELVSAVDERSSSTSPGRSAVVEQSANARQALIQQEEHAANVVCLQSALRVGAQAWPLFIPIDYLVAHQLGSTQFGRFLALRLAGWAIIALGALRLRSSTPVSRRGLQLVDAFVFFQASAIVSVLCLYSGGMKSPYAAGIPVILICRAAFAAQFWKEALLPNALMAIAYPAILLAAAPFSPLIQQQLHEWPALVQALVYVALAACTMVFSVLGGHTRWSLRREVFQARAVGRYRVRRKLGEGGMGDVWAADHQGLKRQVAIKVLRPVGRFDPTAVRRFEREAQALSLLTHPNTVRVFDYGVTADGLWYYTMELLDGMNLAELVANTGRLAPQRAIHLLLQATRALAEAHARGIVHRDIKPQNLFVTTAGGETDTVKLLDFGIAKLESQDAQASLTGSGWIGGTPAYISPEVAAGKPADARADQYALGATLFFSLTGEPPFAASNPAGMLHAHVNTPPRAPSEVVRGGIPQALDAIVLRCLAKDPAERYENVGALARALDGVLGVRWH